MKKLNLKGILATILFPFSFGNPNFIATTPKAVLAAYRLSGLAVYASSVAADRYSTIKALEEDEKFKEVMGYYMAEETNPLSGNHQKRISNAVLDAGSIAVSYACPVLGYSTSYFRFRATNNNLKLANKIGRITENQRVLKKIRKLK